MEWDGLIWVSQKTQLLGSESASKTNVKVVKGGGSIRGIEHKGSPTEVNDLVHTKLGIK